MVFYSRNPQLLVQMVGSEDEILQEAAAGCLRQIRELAVAIEKAREDIEKRREEERKRRREKKKRKFYDLRGKSEELLVLVGRFPLDF